jgi:DNA-binding transcriptional LysR family regulator
LEQGKLDLSILRAPLQSLKIDSKLWFNDGYALVYNKKLFQLKTDKDIAKLADATFVFFNKDYAPHYYHSLLEICASYGFSPNVVHESNNINSIIQLVRNGLGVSIVPASLAHNYTIDEIEFFELKNTRLFTEVMLATPKGEKSEIAEAAMKFLMSSLV